MLLLKVKEDFKSHMSKIQYELNSIIKSTFLLENKCNKIFHFGF